MESVRKLLCCSCWETRLDVTPPRGPFEIENRRKNKSIYSNNIINKSMSITDGLTASPFDDLDSINSHGTDDDTDDELHIESEHQYERVSVSTRSRYTYGLDAFEKNAMIILAQSGERGQQVKERIDLLKSRFGDFRFETEVYVDKTKEEIETTLEEFFSRDFAAVGAVAVAVLAQTGEAGLLAARAQRYHESVLLRWLTEDQPSSLRGKPKIYISEVNRMGVTADGGVYTLPLNAHRDLDIVGVHIPVVVDGESHPLKILCEQLSNKECFVDGVYTAILAAEVTFPELKNRPIQVVNTLQRELRLEKNAE